MNDQIKRESGVHGHHWDAVHAGYFSDPVVAAPLIEKIQAVYLESQPEVIVDLGGGIGFLLSQLLKTAACSEVRLVNLDDSSAQLEAARSRGIFCLRGAVDAFSRNDLGSEQGRFLFMMRSVLHYFGQKRLCAVLGHIRSQARPGEYFVHQTASFSRQEDAACLNEIYRMMGTKKWYPTCDFLCQCLKNEGWQVLEILPGFSLPLTGCELKKRYKLDQRDILRIKKRCSQNFQVPSEVFESTEENFCAYLHYWIYVCISRNISKNSTS
jgi:hypothetical protein